MVLDHTEAIKLDQIKIDSKEFISKLISEIKLDEKSIGKNVMEVLTDRVVENPNIINEIKEILSFNQRTNL